MRGPRLRCCGHRALGGHFGACERLIGHKDKWPIRVARQASLPASRVKESRGECAVACFVVVIAGNRKTSAGRATRAGPAARLVLVRGDQVVRLGHVLLDGVHLGEASLGLPGLSVLERVSLGARDCTRVVGLGGR